MTEIYDWSDTNIATLKQLWAEGISTAEIGRRMGITKSAVVGKAHRLKLPPRPSPIIRTGVRKPKRDRNPVPRAKGPTLPPLAALTAPPPVIVIPPPPQVRLSRHPCCWPIGEPGTREFRYCDAASVHGRPYCPEHVALAYVAPSAKVEQPEMRSEQVRVFG